MINSHPNQQIPLKESKIQMIIFLISLKIIKAINQIKVKKILIKNLIILLRYLIIKIALKSFGLILESI